MPFSPPDSWALCWLSELEADGTFVALETGLESLGVERQEDSQEEVLSAVATLAVVQEVVLELNDSWREGGVDMMAEEGEEDDPLFDEGLPFFDSEAEFLTSGKRMARSSETDPTCENQLRSISCCFRKSRKRRGRG